jgi:hypothetical protein
MIDVDSPTHTSIKYDCVECGSKNSVSVELDRGFCHISGCLNGDPIQFVFHPHWTKAKASRAGREIWWLK